MKSHEFITELFKNPKISWEWKILKNSDARADFTVGDIDYSFVAYAHDPSNPESWEIEFRNNTSVKDTGFPNRFGITGTGNSAIVLSTVVDIMRSFLSIYRGQIDNLIFSADEPSRRSLYTRMIKSMLPNWALFYTDAKHFVLVPPEEIQEPREVEIDEAVVSKDIVNVLKSKGYRLLGTGADQYAFLEPGTGQVLKIFGAADSKSQGTKLSKSQRMAIFWITYCQKNSKNPFLPKFSAWSEFHFKGKTYLQIRMERLGRSNVNWEHAISTMGEYAELQRGFGYVLSKYFAMGKDKQWYGTPDPMLLQAPATLLMSLGKDNLEVLYNTLEDLVKIGNANGWDWDLHDGNVMTRNDGTPVIVDPWYLGEEGSSWW